MVFVFGPAGTGIRARARNAASRSAIRPLWSSGTSRVTASWGRSHHAAATSASTVAASKRRRTTRAGLPATTA
ncbi:hypothetical protein ACU4GR_00545 [Methylobacterium oryzae CBMB20]